MIRLLKKLGSKIFRRELDELNIAINNRTQNFDNQIQNLKEEYDKKISELSEEIEYAHNRIDDLKYEIPVILKDKNLKIYDIADINETVDKLSKSKASLCRFGDGEYRIISGEGIPFQSYSPELANRLKEIIKSDNSNTLIAITPIYRSSEYSQSWGDRWTLRYLKNNRNKICKLLNDNKKYYDSEVSIAYAAALSDNYEKYYDSLKKIWDNRDVVLVSGKGLLENYKFNILNNAKNINYIEAPSINAFSEYDNILTNIKKHNKNKIILLVLGPTATVLAYDLSLIGYKALDIGHLIKDYDSYKKGINLQEKQEKIKFFLPD